MSSLISVSSASRIVSVDQFRGLVVVGMLIVNFLGSFRWIKVHCPILIHHNTYLSFADTIMPAFHFAVGFSLRLTFLRSMAREGSSLTYFHFLRRIAGLALIGVILEFSENKSGTWEGLNAKTLWEHLSPLLKSGFWNTLTIIAMTSLWILPVIGRGVKTRVVFLCCNMIAHLALCHYFYFHYMFGSRHSLSWLLGTETNRGLDGGPLGFLAWSTLQLFGSFSYDILKSRSKRSAFWVLLTGGLVILMLGYFLTCISTLYPLSSPPAKLPADQDWIEERQITVSASPVIPPSQTASESSQFLTAAPSPFCRPPIQEQRELNHWIATKRVVTLPYQLETTGLSLLLLSLLVLICDRYGLAIGILRTFGQNPLATYITHEVIKRAVATYVPQDSPVMWIAVGFAFYFILNYLFIRSLEKKQIYLRL